MFVFLNRFKGVYFEIYGMFWYLIFNVYVLCELLDEGFFKSFGKLMKVYLVIFDFNDFIEIDINYIICRNKDNV